MRYGIARVAKRWMLVRELDGGALLTVLTGQDEFEIRRVLAAVTARRAAEGYVKLQVGTKFWLVRDGLGDHRQGVAVAHNEDELDALLRAMHVQGVAA